MYLLNLGVVPYMEALDLQHRIVDARKAGRGDDVLILLEHPPVLTLGRRATEENIVAAPELLERMGIPTYRVERGGEVTYHGPGQLVGYPILDLTHFQKDIRKYMHNLEEVLIRTVGDFGIQGERIEGLIGVWVREGDWAPALRGELAQAGLDTTAAMDTRRENKIAALGARIERWITYHGFALNVHPNLHHFDLIVPCGIRDLGATSMQAELGIPISLDQVREKLAGHFKEVFHVSLTPVALPTFLAQLQDPNEVS